jgi:hypothetical protein
VVLDRAHAFHQMVDLFREPSAIARCLFQCVESLTGVTDFGT